MKPFSKSFLSVFLGISALLYVASLGLFSQLSKRYTPPLVDSKLAAQLPAQWTVPHVSSPEVAKSQQLFWFQRNAHSGVALQLRKSPAVFADIFPGYSLSSFSPVFWEAYFKLSFNQRRWVSTFSEMGNFGVSTFVPWAGCASVFSAFGADLVVFGNSEANESLVLSKFSKKLGGKSLSCAGPAKSPKTMTLLASTLGRSGKKARWAVLGYSTMNAFPGRTPADEQLQLSELPLLLDSQLQSQSLFTTVKQAKLSQLVPKLYWEDLFPPNIETVQSFFTVHAPESVSTSTPGFMLGFPIPLDVPHDAASLEKLVAPSLSLREQDRSARCNLQKASAELDELIQALRRLAPHVLIYMPPVTPLAEMRYSSAERACVARMLQSKQGADVHVLTQNWKSYGLEYADFIYRRATDPWPRINVNHTNFWGAQKVTKILAAEMARLNAQHERVSLR